MIWIGRPPRDTAKRLGACLDELLPKRKQAGKRWPAIAPAGRGGRSQHVMLFRADDAQIPGLYGLEGFAPVDAFQPADAARLILQRLAVNEGRPRDFRDEIPDVYLQTIEGRQAIAPAEKWDKKRNAENGELYPVFPFGCFGLALDKLTPGNNDGFLWDTWPELSLRVIAGNQQRNFPNVLKAGVWQHVAVVLDRGIPRVFLDGQLVP